MLLALAQEFARSAYKCSEWPKDVQLVGRINMKHLNNAIRSYAAYDNLSETPILLIVNDIMWKRGEKGLLMTDRNLYFNINGRGTKELREDTSIYVDPIPPYYEDNGELEDKSKYRLFLDTLDLGTSFTFSSNVYALSLFLDAMYRRCIISDELVSGFFSPDQFSPLVFKFRNEGVHDLFSL
ncbi:MAG TPA: hypothetical protein VFR81_29545, partial [Longimicrobium sp.]|nr:hypothetical protein [Longimicrobium sp.]